MPEGLSGYVDIVDGENIQGWAYNWAAPAKPPMIELVQDGRVVCAVMPSMTYPELLHAIGAPGYAPTDGRYLWRVTFPLALGIVPDLPFDIRFAETQAKLDQGVQRTVPRLSTALADFVTQDFAGSIVLEPAFNVDGDTLYIDCTLRNWPGGYSEVMLDLDGWRQTVAVEDRPFEATRYPYRFAFLPGRNVGFLLTVTRADLLKTAGKGLLIEAHNPSGPIDARQRMREGVRNIILIPPSMFDDTLPMPPAANVVRVSGSASDPAYRIGGATTCRQIDMLTRRWTGRSLADCETVVDWGVGCARVLRHLWDSRGILSDPIDNVQQRLIGVDVDPVNVEWCQAHLGNRAGFARIDFAPPTAIPAASVDLLYGISVMTHLTGHSQAAWLGEIRRIVKPGGLVILTANCEWNFLQIWADPAVRFIDRFGFHDAIPDPAIGAENIAHYRATLQTTAHLTQSWGKVLDILDVIPAANSWSQSFVVMKRPL